MISPDNMISELTLTALARSLAPESPFTRCDSGAFGIL